MDRSRVFLGASPGFVSVLVAVFMALQAALGLLFPGAYRDPDWIRAAWFANDWVTLSLAVPILVASRIMARRGSARGLLVWLGMLGYGLYNYAFYLFGAALNVFFPLYVLVLILTVACLIRALGRLDASALAGCFSARAPVRLVGGYYVFVAVSLAAVWLAMWSAYALAGRSIPVEPEVLKLVAALDLTIMVPALSAGGVLLWRRRAWGHVIAAVAGVQGTLYLLVLTVSSWVAIGRGLQDSPGELPIWGTLFVATAAATCTLLASVHGRLPGPARLAPGGQHPGSHHDDMG